jgi:hypothetical protein
MDVPVIIKSSISKAYLKNKGDLATAADDGQLETVPVGSDGTVLTADSSQPTGFNWVTVAAASGAMEWGSITGALTDQTDLENALNGKEPASSNIQEHIAATGNPHGTTKAEVGLGDVTDDAQVPKGIGTAKGSLIGFSASGAPMEVPVGADTKVLTADATQPSGVAWKDAPSGTAAWGGIAGILSDQTDLENALNGKEPASANIQEHIAATGNPHGTTKAEVGLGDVTDDAQVKKAPASTDGNLVAWSGVTGDTVADSGKKISDLALATHSHSGVYEPANANIQPHIASTANPHNVTAAQVLPNQTANNGKFLTTNGTTVSWGDPAAGTPPTGNGFRHVTAGAEDPAAKLVANADVDPAAAISESKLNLNFPTHSSLNDPMDGEKAALVGTSGTPGSGNKYVTNADPRNANARPPTAHGSSAHSGTIGTPSQVGLDNVTNDQQLTVSQLDTDASLAANSDSRLPSQKAVKSYADTNFAPVAKGVSGGNTHDHVGGDGAAITEAALALADNTTGNVSSTKHGFVPKAPNDTTKYLRGDGTWYTPPGSSGSADWGTVTNKPDKYVGPGFDYTNLAAAAAYYASNPTIQKRVHVIAPLTLTGNVTLPANVTLVCHRGNVVNVAAYTLIVLGSVEAGDYQIVDVTGGGSVKFYSGAGASPTPVKVRWFGTKGDGITDDSAAIQAAVNSCQILTNDPYSSVNIGGAVIEFHPRDVHLIGTPINLSKSTGPAVPMGFTHFIVRGNNCSFLQAGDNDIFTSYMGGFTISDMILIGHNTTPATYAGCGFNFAGVGVGSSADVFISRVRIRYFDKCFRNHYALSSRFVDCYAQYCNYGMYSTYDASNHGPTQSFLCENFKTNHYEIAGIYHDDDTGASNIAYKRVDVEQANGQTFVGSMLRNLVLEDFHIENDVGGAGYSTSPEFALTDCFNVSIINCLHGPAATWAGTGLISLTRCINVTVDGSNFYWGGTPVIGLITADSSNQNIKVKRTKLTGAKAQLCLDNNPIIQYEENFLYGGCWLITNPSFLRNITVGGELSLTALDPHCANAIIGSNVPTYVGGGTISFDNANGYFTNSSYCYTFLNNNDSVAFTMFNPAPAGQKSGVFGFFYKADADCSLTFTVSNGINATAVPIKGDGVWRYFALPMLNVGTGIAVTAFTMAAAAVTGTTNVNITDVTLRWYATSAEALINVTTIPTTCKKTFTLAAANNSPSVGNSSLDLSKKIFLTNNSSNCGIFRLTNGYEGQEISVILTETNSIISEFYNYSCDYIYTWSSSLGWSSNLGSSATYNIFPEPFAANDCIYYGAKCNKFNGLNVKYSEAVAGTGLSMVLEYYNGSAWVTLTASDPNVLSGTTNAYHATKWNPPADWKVTTINSKIGYWIRFRISAITTSTAGGAMSGIGQMRFINLASGANLQRTSIYNNAAIDLQCANGIWRELGRSIY